MPKYNVKVSITRSNDKDVYIFASNEKQAEQRAIELVLKWPGVEAAEVKGVELDQKQGGKK